MNGGCDCGDTSCPSCGTAQGTLVECPDGGHCHHDCALDFCWRVRNAGPLSGVFAGDAWPPDVVALHTGRVQPDGDPMGGDPRPEPSPADVRRVFDALPSVQVVRKADPPMPATWPGESPLAADDPALRIVQLARSFPCLRDAAGLSPWDVWAFGIWASGAAPDTHRAAAFILAVWWGRPSVAWRFDVVAAMRSWDAEHRAAFAAWAAAPWWA